MVYTLTVSLISRDIHKCLHCLPSVWLTLLRAWNSKWGISWLLYVSRGASNSQNHRNKLNARPLPIVERFCAPEHIIRTLSTILGALRNRRPNIAGARAFNFVWGLANPRTRPDRWTMNTSRRKVPVYVIGCDPADAQHLRIAPQCLRIGCRPDYHAHWLFTPSSSKWPDRDTKVPENESSSMHGSQLLLGSMLTRKQMTPNRSICGKQQQD